MSERTKRINLETFLYILMRDKLLTGEVRGIIKEYIEGVTKNPEYTNKHLADMAEEYADLISNA